MPVNKFMYIFIFLFVCISTSRANTEPRFDTLFSQTYIHDEVSMNLRGFSTKNFIFKKIFASGLYLPESVEREEIFNNVSKRIEVYYFHDVSKDRLTKYTIRKMEDNLSDEKFKALDQELEKLNEYFVNLKPGDRFALTYVPGIGTKFEHNGKLRGIIEGDIFAEGLFSVWLGEDPMDKRIREEMLGFQSS